MMNEEFYKQEIDPEQVLSFKEYLTVAEYYKFERECVEVQTLMHAVFRKYNEIVADRLSRQHMIQSIIEKYNELNSKYKTLGAKRLLLDQKFEIALTIDKGFEDKLNKQETLFLSDLLLHLNYIDTLLNTNEHRNPDQA